MTGNIARSTLLRLWLALLLGVLRRRPDRAIAICYWYLTGRRVRARNRLRDAVGALPAAYQAWIQIVELPEVAAFAAGSHCAGGPRFSIVIHAPDWASSATLDRSLASIRRQHGADCEVIVFGARPPGEIVMPGLRVTHLPLADAAAATGLGLGLGLGLALTAAEGDYLVILPPDGLLPDGALARYRKAALEAPAVAVFYGDEDIIDPHGGRTQPWFKPRWNSELILAQDYVSHACAIAMPNARMACAVPADLADCAAYAMLLSVAAQERAEIQHLAHVLCHLPAMPRCNQAARVLAVSRRIAAQGARAEPGPFATVRVRWPLPDPIPSVTIVVPTRDRVELLDACVGSLLRETSYPDYDIVVVDNGSIEPRTHDWFATMAAHPRVSILLYDHPYNYSAINNAAVAQSRGSYLCLLNNDTEIIEGSWLTELMRYATRTHVGAVGAKLLYGDGSIQHAGVLLGIGGAAGHAHRGLRDDEPGYFAMAHSAHYATAVTAACLVVERAKFEAVGGFDEAMLQIAYNDVDLCLKLERAGWRNVYAPQAMLTHHESKSRGLDLSPEHFERYRAELAVLQERWNTVDAVDPLHHPYLDRSSETYRVRF